MSNSIITQVADTLCRRLLSAGFIVHRYDAYSTNSIYLKLDCGVCNSIRISDHTGKGYLKYRYNIESDIRKKQKTQDTFPRYYYPISDSNALIEQILRDRAEKQKKYRKSNYQTYVKENEQKHKKDAGFWSQARRVYPYQVKEDSSHETISEK